MKSMQFLRSFFLSILSFFLNTISMCLFFSFYFSLLCKREKNPFDQVCAKKVIFFSYCMRSSFIIQLIIFNVMLCLIKLKSTIKHIVNVWLQVVPYTKSTTIWGMMNGVALYELKPFTFNCIWIEVIRITKRTYKIKYKSFKQNVQFQLNV